MHKIFLFFLKIFLHILYIYIYPRNGQSFNFDELLDSIIQLHQMYNIVTTYKYIKYTCIEKKYFLHIYLCFMLIKNV